MRSVDSHPFSWTQRSAIVGLTATVKGVQSRETAKVEVSSSTSIEFPDPTYIHGAASDGEAQSPEGNKEFQTAPGTPQGE